MLVLVGCWPVNSTTYYLLRTIYVLSTYYLRTIYYLLLLLLLLLLHFKLGVTTKRHPVAPIAGDWSGLWCLCWHRGLCLLAREP